MSPSRRHRRAETVQFPSGRAKTGHATGMAALALSRRALRNGRARALQLHAPAFPLAINHCSGKVAFPTRRAWTRDIHQTDRVVPRASGLGTAHKERPSHQQPPTSDRAPPLRKLRCKSGKVAFPRRAWARNVHQTDRVMPRASGLWTAHKERASQMQQAPTRDAPRLAPRDRAHTLRQLRRKSPQPRPWRESTQPRRPHSTLSHLPAKSRPWAALASSLWTPHQERPSRASQM